MALFTDRHLQVPYVDPRLTINHAKKCNKLVCVWSLHIHISCSSNQPQSNLALRKLPPPMASLPPPPPYASSDSTAALEQINYGSIIYLRHGLTKAKAGSVSVAPHSATVGFLGDEKSNPAPTSTLFRIIPMVRFAHKPQPQTHGRKHMATNTWPQTHGQSNLRKGASRDSP